MWFIYYFLDIDIDKVKVVNSTKPISFSNYFLYYIILEGLEPGYYYETIPSTTAIIQYTYFSNSFNYCILINQISYGLNLTKEYEITMNFNDGKSFSFKLDTYYSLCKFLLPFFFFLIK